MAIWKSEICEAATAYAKIFGIFFVSISSKIPPFDSESKTIVNCIFFEKPFLFSFHFTSYMNDKNNFLRSDLFWVTVLEVFSAFEAIKTFGSDIVNSAKRKKSIKKDCFAIQPNIKKACLHVKLIFTRRYFWYLSTF